MFDLACKYPDTKPTVLRQIAARQAIPEQYLEQIFSLLRRANLVTSVRGPQGGYTLAHAPEQITVGRVIAALEGSLAPADCILQDDDICDRCSACPTRYIWQKMWQGINEVVESITLADMVADYREKYLPAEQPTALKE